MGLRDRVKHRLRVWGYFLTASIHERMNVHEQAIHDLAEQHNAILQFLTGSVPERLNVLDQRIHDLAQQHHAILERSGTILERDERRARHETAISAHVHSVDQRLQDLLGRTDHILGHNAALRDQSGAIMRQGTAILGHGTATLEQGMAILGQGRAILEQGMAILGQGRAILEQHDRRAQSETALLQSSVFLVEALQRLQSDFGAHAADLLRSVAAQIDALWVAAAESQRERQDAMVNALDALSVRTEAALQTTAARSEQSQAASHRLLHEVAATSSETREFLDKEATRQICVEVDDYAALNPEIGLMSYLYSYLPSHKALDIGAHEGAVSDYLLKSGYEVYAFEPFPDSYERLVARLKDNPRFHPFNVALGSRRKMMALHTAVDRSAKGIYDDATAFNSLAPHSMPDDLPFQGSVRVPVRTIADLHQENDLPGDIGLAKIDTEGYDLEVIRGMKEHRYPVVGVEFWDPQIPFGQTGLLYTVESIVAEMRERGYAWHLVLYRIWGRQHTAYYSNHNQSVPHSWGNIYFFREHDLFAHARRWCSAVLPRTYFKAAPAREPTRTQ